MNACFISKEVLTLFLNDYANMHSAILSFFKQEKSISEQLIYYISILGYDTEFYKDQGVDPIDLFDLDTSTIVTNDLI